MSAVIIDGHQIANKIKDEIVKDVIELNGGNRDLKTWARADSRPSLAIILVGKKEDSFLYVNLKEKEAKKVGIDTHLYKIPETSSEQEIIEVIEHLNQDKDIDAILVQLPLPKNYNTNKIIDSITPQKDLDRFHKKNQEALFDSCDHDHLMPPVYMVVFKILEEIKQEPRDKKVSIISNSEVFGSGLARAFECRGARAKAILSSDKELDTEPPESDIVVSAVGSPGFLGSDMIKKGAIVIDIGIKKEGPRVYGDVDFEKVKDKAGFLTPVPGGVGPITIAMALKNTLDLYKKNKT